MREQGVTDHWSRCGDEPHWDRRAALGVVGVGRGHAGGLEVDENGTGSSLGGWFCATNCGTGYRMPFPAKSVTGQACPPFLHCYCKPSFVRAPIVSANAGRVGSSIRDARAPQVYTVARRMRLLPLTEAFEMGDPSYSRLKSVLHFRNTPEHRAPSTESPLSRCNEHAPTLGAC